MRVTLIISVNSILIYNIDYARIPTFQRRQAEDNDLNLHHSNLIIYSALK